MANNDAAFFGGVNPSTWGDGNGMAHQMSSSSDVLRTLFTRDGPALGTLKNANVYVSQWESYSSTNSRHAATLFRVENTTGSDIVWNVSWYATAYYGWSERASVSLNGAHVWDTATGAIGGTTLHTTGITIPAGRTSTVIFVAASSPPSGASRTTLLAFANDSLVLPAGLQCGDHMDTKRDGWDH